MFLTFWPLFLKMFIFEDTKFHLTKYPINLIFSVAVCIWEIYFFIIKKCVSYKISGSGHLYLMDFFDIFTSDRYHRDMKALKILDSNSKNFNKWKIGVPRLIFKYYFFFDNFCFKQPLVLKNHWGMFFDSRNWKMISKFSKTYWFWAIEKSYKSLPFIIYL